jgi:hypothetical protein
MSVLNVCNCCRKEREEEGLQPRTLESLPIDVVNNDLFERKGMSVKVCEYCDGDLLPAALKAHERRQK